MRRPVCLLGADNAGGFICFPALVLQLPFRRPPFLSASEAAAPPPATTTTTRISSAGHSLAGRLRSFIGHRPPDRSALPLARAWPHLSSTLGSSDFSSPLLTQSRIFRLAKCTNLRNTNTVAHRLASANDLSESRHREGPSSRGANSARAMSAHFKEREQNEFGASAKTPHKILARVSTNDIVRRGGTAWPAVVGRATPRVSPVRGACSSNSGLGRVSSGGPNLMRLPVEKSD